ncbi:MAG: hypothetical protein ACC657_12535 [Thiohalomonadales bacterium]
MKMLAYSFMSGILFLSLFSIVQACDDVVDPTAAYDAYEFEAVDD